MRLQVEIATASRIDLGRDELAARAPAALASVSARRSRSATGAVLCEMPRSSSSALDAASRGARLARAGVARVGELVELGQVALEPRQLGRP